MKQELAAALSGMLCGSTMQEQSEKLLACNEKTAQYGLTLTPLQAQALTVTRAEALSKAGRIELGDGITEKLILAFCDSPYLSGENYEEVLHELLECFYLFKNETADCIGDDALLRFLRKQFDGPCGGSVRLLTEDALPNLARKVGRMQTKAFSLEKGSV